MNKIITIFGNRIVRITLAVAGAILACAAGIWLLLNFWPAFILAGGSVVAFYLFRRTNSGINIGNGLTVTPDALRTYLRKVVKELESDINPEIRITGWGDNFVIKMTVDFPSDPEEAADFHSRIIYLKGHVARRLMDDFRVHDATIEIEAVQPSLISSRG